MNLSAWADDVLVRAHQAWGAATLLVQLRAAQVRARRRDTRSAEVELLAAIERAEAARWRLLLATGRLERAVRMLAQLRDSDG